MIRWKFLISVTINNFMQVKPAESEDVMADKATKRPSIEELTTQQEAILKEVHGVRDITFECSQHIGRVDKMIGRLIEDFKDQEATSCPNSKTYAQYELDLRNIQKELEIIVYENERIITAYALGEILQKYS